MDEQDRDPRCGVADNDGVLVDVGNVRAALASAPLFAPVVQAQERTVLTSTQDRARRPEMIRATSLDLITHEP
jgi:hypothetical protein